jgi:DNA repair protein RadC
MRQESASEPREILKQCLLRGAAGLVLFHTHPRGDPTPSAEDVLFTRRMAEAAAAIGVELVDRPGPRHRRPLDLAQGARRLVTLPPNEA